MKKLIIALGNGFGLGLSPVASGTVGSLWGVVLVIGMHRYFSTPVYIAVAVALSLLSIPICDIAEKHYGRKDDGRIVADEYLTYPLCMIGLPTHPAMMVTAFITCRVMDIIKPSPAREAQKLKGGLGIAVDDMVSTLYSLLLNHLIYWLYCTYVVKGS